jgi:hypothetical protein
MDAIPWPVAVVAALTLGLAPFAPKPHIIEKLEMLRAGSLRRPLDIFDLIFHGAPWAVLTFKVLRGLGYLIRMNLNIDEF